MQANKVIVKPVITEKSNRLTKENVFSFEVTMSANKHQIAEALKALYGVEVSFVRIAARKGKEKRVGRTMKTKMTPDKKIAYVKVSKGTLDLFPTA